MWELQDWLVARWWAKGVRDRARDVADRHDQSPIVPEKESTMIETIPSIASRTASDVGTT